MQQKSTNFNAYVNENSPNNCFNEAAISKIKDPITKNQALSSHPAAKLPTYLSKNVSDLTIQLPITKSLKEPISPNVSTHPLFISQKESSIILPPTPLQDKVLLLTTTPIQPLSQQSSSTNNNNQS
jgi:hypothetical protein